MPRRYRRRRYAITRPVRTTKYSNETYNFADVMDNNRANTHFSVASPILPVLQNATILGTRKAKNFTVRINVFPTLLTNTDGEVNPVPSRVVWALVYVPEGTNASAINIGTGAVPASLYDPNQNVISSGVASSVNGGIVSKTRLARNLNSGDQIVLIVWDYYTPNATVTRVVTEIYASVNFAIAF